MRRYIAFSAVCLALLASCTKPAMPPRTELVLGTVCTVNAFSDGSDALYQELFDCLRGIDALFNVNIPGTDVSRINAAAGLHGVAVTPQTYSVLETALQYARQSGGSFDPTVGALVRLWAINTDQARVPAQDEIRAAQELTDWQRVVCSESDGGHTVFLPKAGMSLDLGGIVKGYAADEMTKILFKYKVKRCVVDLGGNIVVCGRKADRSPWCIGIKNPADTDGTPALALALSGSGTVVTSGVYERFFVQDGVRYHHILSPQTGSPARTGLLSVTVTGASSMQADALSTILFLLGTERGFAFLQRHAPDAAAVFIGEDNAVTASKQLEGKIEVLDNAFSVITYR